MRNEGQRVSDCGLPLAEVQGGGYFVTVPQLPGCVSDGKTREEAVRYTEFAIEAWIAMVRDIGAPYLRHFSSMQLKGIGPLGPPLIWNYALELFLAARPVEPK